ncbi:class I SAM-dependent methyltransferase [Mycobacterium sp. 236(2023)]|uniref:class I SAM-dependent methyltransferase n=1 Tax=Mycobacterium sp. 236(2023) TaxID=3038163 RepID=UPI0024156B08|nr:class I SAM-dependent methyltransferase [Mycobacterium sp. 236(2023)]MDG4663968.1 class I SAM-dependent methyltransferase [Mycobacterium sp. 236(2023)]
MARTADDSWDLASSVGATATMVAAGRAAASADPDPLINDPFAEPLVRAVGIEFFTKLLDGEIDTSQFPDSSAERVQAMIDGMAVRTKFFDDCCAAATAAGVRQVVILASGLDARAYRLTWPAGTVVYELDQPKVIAFKTQTLSGLGAQPTATHRPVAIDLREDWPTALRDAGFDSSQPTAWLAEGLLIYLPPEAQDALFDRITALSAPGSSIATEYAPGIIDFDATKVSALSEPLREHGLDLDMPSLVYAGARSHVMEYLSGTGWTVTGAPRLELFERYGRTAPPVTDETDPLGEIVYVSATLERGNPG